VPDIAKSIVQELNEKLVFDLDSIERDLNKKNKNDQDEDMIGLANAYQLNENYQQCCQSESNYMFVDRVRKLSDFVVNTRGADSNLFLNKETFLKSVNLIDIVSTESTRSNCFTKKLPIFSYLNI
jgi:hypothetical protein